MLFWKAGLLGPTDLIGAVVVLERHRHLALGSVDADFAGEGVAFAHLRVLPTVALDVLDVFGAVAVRLVRKICCTPDWALLTSSLVVTKKPGFQKPRIRIAAMIIAPRTPRMVPIAASDRFEPPSSPTADRSRRTARATVLAGLARLAVLPGCTVLGRRTILTGLAGRPVLRRTVLTGLTVLTRRTVLTGRTVGRGLLIGRLAVLLRGRWIRRLRTGLRVRRVLRRLRSAYRPAVASPGWPEPWSQDSRAAAIPARAPVRLR